MKKHKKLAKAILIIVLIGVLGALAAYEASSILRKEHVRQNDIFASSKETINHELDKIKVAIITKAPEEYENSLESIKNELITIKMLSFVAPEQTDYIEKLSGYIGLLDDKGAALAEMQTLSEKINAIKNKLEELYKDEGGITKEKVQSAKDDINSLKINAEEYQDEKVKKVIETVNEIIGALSEGANGLAECIDECYENRFGTLSDELSNKLKGSVDSLPSLNSGFEEIFQFENLEEIQKGNIKPEETD